MEQHQAREDDNEGRERRGIQVDPSAPLPLDFSELISHAPFLVERVEEGKRKSGGGEESSEVEEGGRERRGGRGF